MAVLISIRNLNSLLIKILKGLEDQWTSPCQILWRSVKQFINNRFFKIAAVRHLGLACVWTTREEYLVSYHYAKLDSNRYSSFNNMRVLIFCEFVLKMLIHVNFWVILMDLTLKWGTASTKPKDTCVNWTRICNSLAPEKLPGKRCGEEQEEEHGTSLFCCVNMGTKVACCVTVWQLTFCV